jgi:cyclohexa-1,5-dienecarbonyl-CoA hydratase
MSADTPVEAQRREGGALLHVRLARPRGNLVDAEMVAGLRRVVQEAVPDASLRAIVFEGEGPHFSYGASVEEHLPDRVARMLRGFHRLFRELIAARRPLLAVVRGQCLGGGLELATFCHRVFAAPDARLGQPEIRLGVFAPIASLVLPRRVGQAHADDLLLSGRTVDAQEALAMGLVDDVSEDPGEAALAWAREHLLDKSGASLAVAAEAARYWHDRVFLQHLDYIETLYLERLMSFHDAEEGVRAFLEKRRPVWSHS